MVKRMTVLKGRARSETRMHYVTMAIKQLYGQHGERSKAGVSWQGRNESVSDAAAPV